MYVRPYVHVYPTQPSKSCRPASCGLVFSIDSRIIEEILNEWMNELFIASAVSHWRSKGLTWFEMY